MTRRQHRARHFADSTLVRWGVDEPVFSQTVLAVSELVSNALRYSGGDVQLRLRRTAHQLHVDVRDDSRNLPVQQITGPFDEGGRGLQLVAHVAERWGARRTGKGKSVWCEFDLAPPSLWG